MTFLISLIEIMTFLLAFYSMDLHRVFDEHTPEFFKEFRFYCMEHQYSRWVTDVTPFAEILFTMHVIVIFMYSTINLMVLSTVPYRYNRFKDEKKKPKSKEKIDDEKTEKNVLLSVEPQ